MKGCQETREISNVTSAWALKNVFFCIVRWKNKGAESMALLVLSTCVAQIGGNVRRFSYESIETTHMTYGFNLAYVSAIVNARDKSPLPVAMHLKRSSRRNMRRYGSKCDLMFSFERSFPVIKAC